MRMADVNDVMHVSSGKATTASFLVDFAAEAPALINSTHWSIAEMEKWHQNEGMELENDVFATEIWKTLPRPMIAEAFGSRDWTVKILHFAASCLLGLDRQTPELPAAQAAQRTAESNECEADTAAMAPLPFFYSREREDNVVTMPASRSPLSHHLQQRNHRKLSQPSEHQKKPWRKPWHCKTSLCLKVRPPNSLQLEVVEIEELLIESAVPARRIPEATRDVINITCCIWNPSCWTRCWSSTTSLEGGSCQKRDGKEISKNSDPAIYFCSPAIRPKPSKIAALPAPPKIPFWKRHSVPNQEDAIGTACSTQGPGLRGVLGVA